MSLIRDYILNYVWSPCVWKDGQRKKENFLSAHFLALDFDTPGDETLEEINHALQDHKRIIATTRNHQKEKNGITCDRFRLILPFDKPITNLEHYEQNMRCAVKKYPWVDRNALDGARYFFPSNKIVYFDDESEYAWETQAFVENEIIKTCSKPTGKIPGWCLAFINDGVRPNDSRNMRVFSVAYELFVQGFCRDDVVRLIRSSPIDWHGVNWQGCIRDAEMKVGKLYDKNEKGSR